jgi:hypothetical protein
MERLKSVTAEIQRKVVWLGNFLNERHLRLWAGAEALNLGRGGISRVAQATGLSRKTVRAGIRELLGGTNAPELADPVRVRRPGAGRKSLVDKNPTLIRDLGVLLDPQPSDLPALAVRWTCWSTTKLASFLQASGHAISPRKVAQLLHQLGFSFHAGSKTGGDAQRLEYDNQFRHINLLVHTFWARGEPALHLTVAKMRQVAGIGEMLETSQLPDHSVPENEYRPQLRSCSRCEIGAGTWAGREADRETIELGVTNLRCWWRQHGQQRFPTAREMLLICSATRCPGRGSWKPPLQVLANDTGLRIIACHVPPASVSWVAATQQGFCSTVESALCGFRVRHESVLQVLEQLVSPFSILSPQSLQQNKVRNGPRDSKMISAHSPETWNDVLEPSKLSIPLMKDDGSSN